MRSSSSFFGLKIELLFVFFCFFFLDSVSAIWLVFQRVSVDSCSVFDRATHGKYDFFSSRWSHWLIRVPPPPPTHFSFLILFSPPCHIRKPLSLFCYFFHLLISSIFWGSDIIPRYPSIRRSFLHVTHVFSLHDEYFPVDVRGGGCFIKS